MKCTVGNTVSKWLQPLWKTVWGVLKKLKIDPPYDPAIPLLSIYPKKTKTLIGKDTSTLLFTATLFKIAKIWKQPKRPSTDECIKKIWYRGRSQDGRVRGHGVRISSQLGHLLGAGEGHQTLKGTGGTPE